MKTAVGVLIFVIMVAGCGNADDAKPSIVQTKSVQAAGETQVAAPQTETPPTSGEFPLALYPKSDVLSKNMHDKTVQADIESGDPVDKVIAFYEKELGAKSDGRSPMTTIMGDKAGYHFAVIIAPKQGKKAAISILGEKK